MSITIPRTQSPISMRLLMLSLNLLAGACSLNVTFGMAWTKKDIDCFINATNPLYKLPSSCTPKYPPDWYCADFCKKD